MCRVSCPGAATCFRTVPRPKAAATGSTGGARSAINAYGWPSTAAGCRSSSPLTNTTATKRPVAPAGQARARRWPSRRRRWPVWQCWRTSHTRTTRTEPLNAPQDVAEFERGYRDALYNQGYHNYNNRPDYSNGYNKGSRTLTETSYRSNQGHHSGYCLRQRQRPGRCTCRRRRRRLAGARLPQHQQLQGQRPCPHLLVESSTRQCLNAAVYEGRVESLESTGESYCQR